MQAIKFKQYGDNSVIFLEDSATPKPNAQQVLVKIIAAAINPVDWKIRSGALQNMLPLTFPSGLGMDFSGVIEELGSEVSCFKKGDEVYGLSNFCGGNSGAFAEYALVNADFIAVKPKNISHCEAATLPMAGVSAWQALIDYMQLKKGQKILIHGGAGSIGTFAIQIAKALGAYVATTASEDSRAFVEKLGVDRIINYRDENFEKSLKNYDAVLDTVGGEVYKKSFQVLKKGGILVSMLEAPNQELMERYKVKAFVEFTEVTTERLNQFAKLITEHEIKIPIAKKFPLVEIKKALDFQQYQHPRGKVVVET